MARFFHILSAAHQKVQHVPAVFCLAAVKLGVAAARAADGDEFLVLHIENFGKVPACGLELVAFILRVAAFGAYILHWFHIRVSFVLLCRPGRPFQKYNTCGTAAQASQAQRGARHGTHQAPQRGVVHANGLQKHHHSRTGGHKQTGCCQHGRPPSFPASACRPSARQAQPRPNRAPLPLPSAAAKHKLAAIRQAKFVFCARSIRSLLFRGRLMPGSAVLSAASASQRNTQRTG